LFSTVVAWSSLGPSPRGIVGLLVPLRGI